MMAPAQAIPMAIPRGYANYVFVISALNSCATAMF